MDSSTQKKIDDAVALAVKAQDDANELLKQVLVDEVRSKFPQAQSILLEQESDHGIQWYWLVAIRDTNGDDLQVESVEQEWYELVDNNVVQSMFVTPDFSASYITIDMREPLS